MILADFLLPGSVSLKRIRIRLTKMKRIQTDPDPDLDPQHCFVGFGSALTILGLAKQSTFVIMEGSDFSFDILFLSCRENIIAPLFKQILYLIFCNFAAIFVVFNLLIN